jgi:hypothetical protein
MNSNERLAKAVDAIDWVQHELYCAGAPERLAAALVHVEGLLLFGISLPDNLQNEIDAYVSARDSAPQECEEVENEQR